MKKRNIGRRSFTLGIASIAVGLGATSAEAGGWRRWRRWWRRRRSGGGGGSAPCFLAGTRILTSKGEVNVECLKAGDLVVTASGDERSIKWVGRTDCCRMDNGRWAHKVLPIKIKASAITDAVPSRDLYVSPAHKFYLDGVLIPAENLINGRSVVRVDDEDVANITYYHVELETHDVIIAEGAAVETFLPLPGARNAFSNYAEFEELYPCETNSPAVRPCAPVQEAWNRREKAASKIRRAIAPLVDKRRPLELVGDRLAQRAARPEMFTARKVMRTGAQCQASL